MKEFNIKHDCIDEVRSCISCCQEKKHIQQVAFSTYHHALTQICYTCKEIITSIKEEDLQ